MSEPTAAEVFVFGLNFCAVFGDRSFEVAGTPADKTNATLRSPLPTSPTADQILPPRFRLLRVEFT